MKTAGIIFACMACLLGGLAAGFNLQKGNARQTFIKLQYGDNALEIDLDQDQEIIENETLLKEIFGEEFSRSGTIKWLKDSQRIYHYMDNELVDEFSKLEYESKMAGYLRNLRASGTGPWDSPLDTIRIGVPKLVDQPRNGYCSVCKNKMYRGKTLRLYNLDNPAVQLIVKATGTYPCPSGLQAPDLQLNGADADSILGTSRFSKYNQALIVIEDD